MNLERIISKSALPSAKWLMRALAASAEAFLRHSFGQRYTGSLLSGLLLAAGLTMLIALVPQDGRISLMPLATTGLLLRIVAHLVSVRQRRRAGIHIESHSSGIPWSFWSRMPVPPEVVRVVLEPLACLVAALLLSSFDLMAAVWLCFAGLALLAKAVVEHHNAHERTLNALDARIAARNLRTAVNQHLDPHPQASDTPVAVSVPPPANPVRQGRDFSQNLDPALRRLMHEDTHPAPPAPIHVRPSGKEMIPSPQPSATGRIHVRPARVPDSDASRQQTSTPAKPRVVVVRTRPAPTERLHVSPTKSAPASAELATSAAQPSVATASEATTIQCSSRTPPLTKAAEIPGTQAQEAEQTAPLPQANKLQIDDGGDEPGKLCRQFAAQAETLCFTVEAGANRAPGSPTPDLLIKKGSVCLAVQFVATADLANELEHVTDCLADGVSCLALVCPNPERLAALAKAMHTALPPEQASKLSFFTPQEFSSTLHRLAQTTATTAKRRRQSS